MNRGILATVAFAAVVVFPSASAFGQDASRLTVTQARERVGGALVVQQAGRFSDALRELDLALLTCGDAGCRTEIELGLGQIHQRQAARDRVNADTLYMKAADHYQAVLRADPGQREALFATAQVYRAIGPHEWQESFFRQAPTLDPTRRALYLSYAGDYYFTRTIWSQAATQYRQALDADPDDPGARVGLVECLKAWGRSGMKELLQRGGEWELSSPDIATRAYSYALSLALRAPPDSLTAENALVGLVSLQARSGRTTGILPDDLPQSWEPSAELQKFLRLPDGPTPLWWRRTPARAETIELISLARGRELVSRGDAATAERVWRSRLGAPTSGTQLDLRRELAMLYFGYPQLDPGNSKFNQLEQEIFIGKGIALTSGNLEAAQRFHTALGLIYSERSAWTGPYAHNARDQLTWALDKARTRAQSDGFYQPLPGLEQRLAHGLESIGQRTEARVHYLNAAMGYFDTDDFDDAVASLRDAVRLGAVWTAATPGESVWTRRAQVASAAEGPAVAGLCSSHAGNRWADAIRRSWGAQTPGDGGFSSRQAFKYDADCARITSDNEALAFAREAFAEVFGGNVTLIGGSDVERFKQVLGTIVSAKGVTLRPIRLARSRSASERAFRVWLAGETEGFWLVPNPGDLDLARGGMMTR